MKTTCALFLMIAWTTLLCGAGYATQSDSAKQQDTKSSGRQTGHRRVSGKNSAHRSGVLPKANRPQPLPNKRARLAKGNDVTTGQTVQNEISGAGSGPRAAASPVRAARAVHSPSLSGSFGQSLQSERHRGTNPATVGGTPKSVVRNTGAVSGTGASHKR